MESFAIYRLPFARQCTLIDASEEATATLSSFEEIHDSAGFVIAPFAAVPSTPIVAIRPSRQRVFSTPDLMPSALLAQLDHAARSYVAPDMSETPERQHYEDDFQRFHSQLVGGEFSKLVLARQSMVKARVLSPTSLFIEACKLYPRCFVALFSTQATGTWLVATPELLISREGSDYRTMALAGTMEYVADGAPRWSDKNVREQRFVTSYIRDAIAPLARTIAASAPRTIRAAHLVHLRSDFTFSLKGSHSIGEIIGALHPTPAICGLPKDKALDFILENEHSPRTYYSGFCGPVGIDGTTCLYVSLRCMQILDSQCCLYAGGGLLPDSTEASEWDETEAKMKTMKRLL